MVVRDGDIGFVGQALVSRLVQEGHHVVALACSQASAQTVGRLGAEPARGDLALRDSVAEAMRSADVVAHLAAETDLRRSPEQFRRTNVAGTRAMVAAASAANVPVFIHMSTEAVLADGRPLRHVSEQHRL